MKIRINTKIQYRLATLSLYNCPMKRVDFIAILLLILSGVVVTADLFIHNGRPATYDGPTHITTITQFYSSLKQAEFPVRWAGNYGNYGQPLGIYAHQLPAYLGALVMFINPDPETAFAVVALVAAVSGTLFIYYLLRHWFAPETAFIGSFFFNLSAYRINNLYMRGALPEFFATTWIILNLLCLIKISHRRASKWWWLIFSLSFAGLLLTHPLLAALWSLVLAILITRLVIIKRSPKLIGQLLLALIVSFLLASYYLVPFVLESKYLIIGQEPNRIPEAATLNHLIDPSWRYFSDSSHPGPRENLPKLGLIEFGLLLTGFILIIAKPSLFRQRGYSLIRTLIIIGWLLLILTLPRINLIYESVPFLNKIQYTWRWFGILMIIPPIILTLLLEKIRRPGILVLVIALIIAARFPQLYGKNYYQIPQEAYYQTVATLHTDNLSTVWMGHWRDYPPKSSQFQVIDGDHQISNLQFTNTRRSFMVSGTSEAKLVDYTFYFPGWQVFIDDQPQPIEFQDPNHRGMITFKLPAGTHEVLIAFNDTRTRSLANLMSLGGLIIIAGASLWLAILNLKNDYLPDRTRNLPPN
jgi:hypothetical protein